MVVMTPNFGLNVLLGGGVGVVVMTPNFGLNVLLGGGVGVEGNHST